MSAKRIRHLVVIPAAAAIMFCLVVVSGCEQEVGTRAVKTDSEPRVVQTAEPAEAFSFEDAAITLPSPGSVKLDPKGRLGERFQGNINYLRHLHDHDGKAMLEAYDVRHYAPGKFLELIWDREYAGKWIDAATRTAVSAGDDAQVAMVDAFVASVRQRQQADGYMGIKLPTDRELDKWEQNWDLWNQWNALMGFLTHYELRGDRHSLETASRIGAWILKTYSPVESGEARFFNAAEEGATAGEKGFTNVVVIGQLVRLYRHTGNEDVIEFVRQVIQHFPPIERMRSTGEPEQGHGYMLSAILGGAAEFAQVTQDNETLAWVEAVWQRMASDHLFPTGSLGEGESLRGGKFTDRADAPYQETCATTEWIFFTQSLYGVTGRAKYIEALEQTSYNALLAAQSVDGMKWTYFLPLRYHKDWFHGPTKCCYWSGPKGIARFPQLIFASKGNIICVNFFETSHATLDTDGGEVHVIQDSQFPEIGRSKIAMETPAGWKGNLRIRVPSWSTGFQVYLNGQPAPSPAITEGYCDIDLPESTEHQVEVRFDIPIVREQFAEGYFMRRGPELLSIDVRDNIETLLPYVSFPQEVVLQPADPAGNRRRYRADLEYLTSGEPRSFMFTPYADAGNDGAAFRTVFSSRKTLEEGVEIFAPGWTAANCIENDELGLHESEGIGTILATHPVAQEIPCVLSKRLAIPKDGKTSLKLVFGHGPNEDWELIVKADGKEIASSTVGKETTTDGFMELSIDLWAYAGRTVLIELLNQANGWQLETDEFETGVWVKIELVTE